MLTSYFLEDNVITVKEHRWNTNLRYADSYGTVGYYFLRFDMWSCDMKSLMNRQIKLCKSINIRP